jgi:uncharacterized protein YjiS (DUF1127 family)
MAVIAHPALTNSQLLGVRPWFGGRAAWLTRVVATLRVWRRRVHERRALANLTQRELADFGATTADVYRELGTPFWRAAAPSSQHHH